LLRRGAFRKRCKALLQRTWTAKLSIHSSRLREGSSCCFFVRTDCPISNRYAPAIQKLHETFRGKADFWLVYPDAGETAARIHAHDEEFHLTIPALRDVHRELVKRSHATITPESAVFDSNGKLIYHGRIDNWYEDFGRSRSVPTTHELEDAIRSTLNGNATVPDHADAVGCYISDLK